MEQTPKQKEKQTKEYRINISDINFKKISKEDKTYDLIKNIREIINNNNTKMVEEINNNPDRTTPEDNKQDWNEIYDEYSREQWPPFGGPFTNATSLIDWLKQNYESPERLKQ